MIAADDVGRAYAPMTYKVKYKLPPPTDDEQSEDNDEDSLEEEPSGAEGKIYDSRELLLKLTQGSGLRRFRAALRRRAAARSSCTQSNYL